MSGPLPVVYLARHGETAWSLTGQHTGLTDLPLTERGERNARRLGGRLAGLAFAKVFTSPLKRAFRTCELSGFGGGVLVFSSGHFIRVLAARWLGLDPQAPGRHFLLGTASLSAVGYEHDITRPVLRLWNDDRHVGD